MFVRWPRRFVGHANAPRLFCCFYAYNQSSYGFCPVYLPCPAPVSLLFTHYNGVAGFDIFFSVCTTFARHFGVYCIYTSRLYLVHWLPSMSLSLFASISFRKLWKVNSNQRKLIAIQCEQHNTQTQTLKHTDTHTHSSSTSKHRRECTREREKITGKTQCALHGAMHARIIAQGKWLIAITINYKLLKYLKHTSNRTR